MLPSHKLPDLICELNELKEDNSLQRNCQNQFSHPILFHIGQECQESLIQGKIHIQQNLNKSLKYLQG